MKLAPDWKKILRKTWSVRFLALAVVLTGCEVVLPLYSEAFERGTFALLSAFATMAALVARVVAQKDFDA